MLYLPAGHALHANEFAEYIPAAHAAHATAPSASAIAPGAQEEQLAVAGAPANVPMGQAMQEVEPEKGWW